MGNAAKKESREFVATSDARATKERELTAVRQALAWGLLPPLVRVALMMEICETEAESVSASEKMWQALPKPQRVELLRRGGDLFPFGAESADRKSVV